MLVSSSSGALSKSVGNDVKSNKFLRIPVSYSSGASSNSIGSVVKITSLIIMPVDYSSDEPGSVIKIN